MSTPATTPTDTRHRQRWAPEDDALLRERINTHSFPAIAMTLGRSVCTVRQRCSKLGIKRTAPVFDPSNPEHWATLRAKERELKTTRPTPVVNSTVNHKTNPYTAPELAPFSGRPGAMDAFALPSRRGGARYYRDGRVEVVA